MLLPYAKFVPSSLLMRLEIWQKRVYSYSPDNFEAILLNFQANLN